MLRYTEQGARTYLFIGLRETLRAGHNRIYTAHRPEAYASGLFVM